MAGRYDVIVVGVGSMGSSACYQLAKRGVKVLGLEQFSIPNTLGAAGGFSRMIRLSYFEHPDYVALLRRSYELWNQIEKDSGQKLLYVTGGAYVGLPGSELVSGSLQAAQQHGLEHDMLDRAQLADRFPQFNVPDDYVCFYENQAGFVLSENSVAAFADLAMRHGAELHGHEKVIDWTASSSGVEVKTDRDTYRADRIIFSGGAWSGRLLKGLGVELTVTRQVLGWMWPQRPELFELGALPVWAIDPAVPGGEFAGVYYGFPMMTESPGFKMALHFPNQPTDPDAIVRDVIEGDEEEFMVPARKYFPDGAGSLLSVRTCIYTNSSDGHFIIDQHPSHDNVTIACGFSGHGFKFASVVGEILADLGANGETDLPVGFLGLDRFGN